MPLHGVARLLLPRYQLLPRSMFEVTKDTSQISPAICTSAIFVTVIATDLTATRA